MDEILTGDLLQELVVTHDGTTVGSLENLTIDHRTGELLELVIEPSRESITETIECDVDDRGTIRIPVGDIETVRDHIVIDQRRTTPRAV